MNGFSHPRDIGRMNIGVAPTRKAYTGPPRKALEVNPWFRYYVARDGRNSALHEALAVGRTTMTEPGHDCPTCTKPMWYRPIVGAYRCPTCNPGTGL